MNSLVFACSGLKSWYAGIKECLSPSLLRASGDVLADGHSGFSVSLRLHSTFRGHPEHAAVRRWLPGVGSPSQAGSRLTRSQ